ncbi:patatin-like phospholipase family protein [Microbacterium sp. P5_E9]
MIQPIWVLGGGGVAGIAWEIGILTGLADEGAVVAPDAVVLGTSAGAVVGAQVTSGIPLAELYARQEAGVPWARIARQRALLAPDRRVEILVHDADSRRAAGRDVMDRSVAPELVAAGRAQGRREAERVRAALQR